MFDHTGKLYEVQCWLVKRIGFRHARQFVNVSGRFAAAAVGLRGRVAREVSHILSGAFRKKFEELCSK